MLDINTKTNYPYVVNVCKESFMDIEIVKRTCLNIGKMRGKNLNFADGTDRQNVYIKISDFVASATRKLKSEKLKSYSYYNYVDAKLPAEFITKAFDLYEKKRK